MIFSNVSSLAKIIIFSSVLFSITAQGQTTGTAVNTISTNTNLQQLRLATQLPIRNIIPLPKSCFTQGFTIDESIVYLSCGQYQQSKLYTFQLKKNNKLTLQHKLNLPDTLFAEGISVSDNHIFLLSWKSELLFKFNKKNPSLDNVKTFTYKGQGWGLTLANNNSFENQNKNQPSANFLYSNGSHTVKEFTLENKIMKISRHYNMTNTTGREINNINELEIFQYNNEKYLLFNRWHDVNIYMAQLPKNKTAKQTLEAKAINFKALAELHPEGVINGIAFNEKDNSVWITGKYWGTAYQFSAEDLLGLSHSL